MERQSNGGYFNWCRDIKRADVEGIGCGGVFILHKHLKTTKEKGSILALVLIIGATASLLGLTFMQYSLMEARTVDRFKETQDLFYLTEAGIEMGVAALHADPARSETVNGYLDADDPDKGSFKVEFFYRETDIDEDEDLPMGYECLSALSPHEVFIRSTGIIKEGTQEKTLEIWALAEKDYLYNKALISDKLLNLKGLSKNSAYSHNDAGIHGDVHINERLYVEADEHTERNFIRKCPVSGDPPRLTYSTAAPLPPTNVWGSSDYPRLYKETGESGNGVFLPGEGADGGGGYFLSYSRTASVQRYSPESAGFKKVPPLRYDFHAYKQELLNLVQAKSGEGQFVELPGGGLWNSENIHLYNGKKVHVAGDLLVVSTPDNGHDPADKLFFEGVLMVDGTLTFRHYRSENGGSEQLFRGIIAANEINCTYDDTTELPPDSGDTRLTIEGFIMVNDCLSLVTAGSGEEDVPADHRTIRGAVVAGEVFLRGPYTKVCYAEIHELIPDYIKYLPDSGVVIRKLFKPYLMEN